MASKPVKKKVISKKPGSEQHYVELESHLDIYDLWEKLHVSLMVETDERSEKAKLDLSEGEVKLLHDILEKLVTAQDPRTDYYEVVNHRPRDYELAAKKWNAVFEIMLDLRFDVSEDAAKAAAQAKYELNRDQLKRGLKECRTELEHVVGRMSDAAANKAWQTSKEATNLTDCDPIDLKILRVMEYGFYFGQ